MLHNVKTRNKRKLSQEPSSSQECIDAIRSPRPISPPTSWSWVNPSEYFPFLLSENIPATHTVRPPCLEIPLLRSSFKRVTRRSAEETSLKQGDVVNAEIKSTELMFQKDRADSLPEKFQCELNLPGRRGRAGNSACRAGEPGGCKHDEIRCIEISSVQQIE